MNPLTIGVLLFPDFELLDVFGPLEMFGMVPESFRIVMAAERPGVVRSRQGPRSRAQRTISRAFRGRT